MPLYALSLCCFLVASAASLFSPSALAASGTDATVVDYAQCANGKPPSTSTACPDGWINGILQGSNSHYVEDDVTPQRAEVTLPAGGPTIGRTLTFSYEARKNGIHAYDSLATWNHTQGTADRCAGLAAADCVGGSPSTFAVPGDPTAVAPGADQITSHHQLTGQVFTMFGGNLTGASTPVHDNAASSTGDDFATMTVTYSVPDTNADRKVQLLFGGHLAASNGPRGWGASLGSGNINGGPYHIRWVAADGVAIGKRDNQIQGSALVPPNLAITKTADAGTVSAGTTIGYTITVTNSGSGDATNVSLTDTLPTGGGINWSIAGTTGGATCSISAGTLSCSLATLAASKSFSVHVTSPTTKDSCAVYNNTATVKADNNGSVSAGPVTITVKCAQIAITKTTSTPTVSAGTPISYDITVTNNGAGTATNVSMTDTLPTGGGISWTATASGSGSPSCSITTGVLTCTAASLGSGQSFTVHLSSPTDKSSCGVYNNNASVDTGNDGSASAGPVTITVKCAQIAINKTTSTPTVSSGTPISYDITVTNNGAGTATNVSMTDTLPTGGGISWTATASGSGSPSCSITTGVLTCTAASLGSGQSFTVHLSSPTDKTSCAVYKNSASVTTGNDGSASAGPVSITVACPSVTITKTADAAIVSAGDQIGYTITVGNNGPGTAVMVSMSDQLPAGSGIIWTIAGTTGSPSCSINAGLLTCGVQSLGSGASFSVHVTSPTDKTSCATYANTATVSANNESDSPSAGPVTIKVECPQINITKVSDAASVNAGDQIGYTITVTNSGAGTASNVSMTDTLPTGGGISWTATASGSGSPSCSISAGVLTCTAASLGSGQSFTVHLTSPTDKTSCATYKNTASVTTGNDGSASDGPVAIVVNCASIAIAKVADAATVEAGSKIGFTITVTNNGAGTASNVSMSDPLPSGSGIVWKIEGTTGSPACAISSGVVTCTKSSLAPGDSFSVHVTSPTTAASAGQYPNTATVTTGNDGSAQASAAVLVIAPSIDLKKTADPTSGEPGTLITYTFVVTNTGTTTLFNVSIDDDKLGHIGTIASLAPGVSTKFLKTIVLGNSQVTNVGTATGTDVLGTAVKATSKATVIPVLPLVIERPAPTLPVTGMDSGPWLMAGIALLIMGLLLERAGALKVAVAAAGSFSAAIHVPGMAPRGRHSAGWTWAYSPRGQHRSAWKWEFGASKRRSHEGPRKPF